MGGHTKKRIKRKNVGGKRENIKVSLSRGFTKMKANWDRVNKPLLYKLRIFGKGHPKDSKIMLGPGGRYELWEREKNYRRVRIVGTVGEPAEGFKQAL